MTATNNVVKTMMAHKSIRKYKERMPSKRTIQTIARAGQQAPFGSQLYSVLLSRERSRHVYKAPLMFTICVDLNKLELMMARRKWKLRTNDLTLLIFGIEDALLMAENMVIAGESMGLGSCFLGFAMYQAERIAKEYHLPLRVFPIVQLVMGYPDEDPPTRPRYPLEYTLFEGRYPRLDGSAIAKAMRRMDEGYLKQDYYKKGRAKIRLENDRDESLTYDNYSWTEHICRKWGQWHPDASELLEQLERRGFNIVPRFETKRSRVRKSP